MLLTVCRTSPAANVAALLSRHLGADPHSLAVVPCEGDRTSGATALTIMLAMGKDLLRGGGRTNRLAEHRPQARAWLQGHQITTVAIVTAHLLDSRNLAWTLELCRDVNELVLVSDPTGHGRLLETLNPAVLRAAGHPRVRDADLQEWLESRPAVDAPKGMSRRRVPNLTQVTPGLNVCELPIGDFLTWRSDAQRTLPPEAFQHIDTAYTCAFLAASAWEFKDPFDTHRQLERLLVTAASAGQQMAILRAAQVAAFSRGRLLRLNMDRIHNTMATRPVTGQVRDLHWASLNAFVRTDHAASCALYLLGHAVADQNTITLADIAGRLRQTNTGPADPYLRAHLSYRRHQGAAPPDVFLLGCPAQPVLRRARDLLGLPITRKQLTLKDRRTNALLPRLGLNLKDLR